jgi:predicted Rossmann-fold nucleotide-binding protein
MKRVLVCGGRNFSDAEFLNAELDRLHAEHGFTVVIEGCAKGADQLAGLWADTRGIEHLKFPADWEKHKRAAGPIRNEQMLRDGKPDLVVAFPGGRGTAHMIRIAQVARVWVIEPKR